MLSNLGDFKRTHTCGDLRKEDLNKEVILNGWVQKRRDHGGVIFIDLRDRYGVTQIVMNEEHEEARVIGDTCRPEYVVAVLGKVMLRPDGMKNDGLKTGDIEVHISEIRILNTALTPPFMIDDNTDVAEDIRLKYRYLDLRRPELQRNIMLRSNLTRAIREYMWSKDFIDIETPFLTKSTPEGARDYLVPSRVNAGKFYALPQSPQMFKQLLMVGGFDKYYQIVRCFRDEDLRSDRQPEFTQLDIEMSFVDKEDIINMIEGMIKYVFEKTVSRTLTAPFPTMDYADAIEQYGTDAPDTRFDLHLKTLNELVKDCDFKVFAEATKGGVVKAINAKGAGKSFSRKDIDELTDFVGTLGAKGLAYIRINEDGLQSPLIKFLGDDLTAKLIAEMKGEVGDIIFFGAGDEYTVNLYMSKLRLKLGKMLNVIDDQKLSFVWVLNFPLLEYSKEDKRFVAIHHPFTAPLDEDIELLKTAPEKARAKAYDLVLNGSEIGGGSIRIHRSDIQKSMFELMGFTEADLESRFGFFIDALKYGTPPHGGIAFGVDRIAAIITGSTSIRDVIAFPKTQKAIDIMCEAPSFVDKKQLMELSISTDIKE